MSWFKLSILVGLSILPAQAVLLAHYDFTDGDLTDNELGAAETLTLTNQGDNLITISPAGSAIFPGESGDQADYLEVERGLGSPAFTVSLWFKTDTVDQGGFQGIFSNNVSSGASFSWQVDVSDGTLRYVSATGGFNTITNADPGEPQIETGVWHHLVARKVGGGADLWLGSEDRPLELLGTETLNPGGLQYFRLGVNRNSDNLYGMELANVKIYNDSEVSLADLNDEGPQLIPEPTTGLLALLSLPLLLGRRR